MSDETVGCARPTGTVVGEAPPEPSTTNETPENTREARMNVARVGGKAPDFEAPAYYRGTFTTIKLSDYLGKWVMLCFYPGDFTFV